MYRGVSTDSYAAVCTGEGVGESMSGHSSVLGDAHCRGGGGGGHGLASDAAHAPGAEHALQGPQHHHDEQHHQHDEQHHPLPVGQPRQVAHSPALRLRRRRRPLGSADVDADAQGGGAVGGAVLPAGLVAELLAVQPHGLLVLLVGGQLAEHLAAGGQRWGPLLGQHGGVAAEGAGEAGAGAVAVLVHHRHGHEAGEALQAEGVGALQLLGRLEDVVVGVVADGALRLAHHRHLLLPL